MINPKKINQLKKVNKAEDSVIYKKPKVLFADYKDFLTLGDYVRLKKHYKNNVLTNRDTLSINERKRRAFQDKIPDSLRHELRPLGAKFYGDSDYIEDTTGKPKGDWYDEIKVARKDLDSIKREDSIKNRNAIINIKANPIFSRNASDNPYYTFSHGQAPNPNVQSKEINTNTIPGRVFPEDNVELEKKENGGELPKRGTRISPFSSDFQTTASQRLSKKSIKGNIKNMSLPKKKGKAGNLLTKKSYNITEKDVDNVVNEKNKNKENILNPFNINPSVTEVKSYNSWHLPPTKPTPPSFDYSKKLKSINFKINENEKIDSPKEEDPKISNPDKKYKWIPQALEKHNKGKTEIAKALEAYNKDKTDLKLPSTINKDLSEIVVTAKKRPKMKLIESPVVNLDKYREDSLKSVPAHIKDIPLDLTSIQNKKNSNSFLSKLGKGVESVVPYASNLLNAMRTLPKVPEPALIDYKPMSVGKISFDSARREALNQTSASNKMATQSLSPQASAAVRAYNLSKQLDNNVAINEKENNANAQLQLQNNSINSQRKLYTDMQNAQIKNAYLNSVGNRAVDQQQLLYGNVGNASDKFVRAKNLERDYQMQFDLQKLQNKALIEAHIHNRYRQGVSNLVDPITGAYIENKYGGTLRPKMKVKQMMKKVNFK